MEPINPERPDAFVIDDEHNDCRAVSSVLNELGLAVATFESAAQALTALDRHPPKVIFLDIALRQSDAIDVLKGLGERNYPGIVQLFSANARLLEPIQRIALRRHLTVRPPQLKPLAKEIIAQAVAAAGLGGAAVSAAH
jgi:CheY-like chemotaxis protein